MTATRQPGRLIAAGTPSRSDSTPEADWSMPLILLAWAEGHGACGGLRPAPGPEQLECTCGGLRFEVSRPVLRTADGPAGVVLPAAGTEASR